MNVVDSAAVILHDVQFSMYAVHCTVYNVSCIECGEEVGVGAVIRRKLENRPVLTSILSTLPLSLVIIEQYLFGV